MCRRARGLRLSRARVVLSPCCVAQAAIWARESEAQFAENAADVGLNGALAQHQTARPSRGSSAPWAISTPPPARASSARRVRGRSLLPGPCTDPIARRAPAGKPVPVRPHPSACAPDPPRLPALRRAPLRLLHRVPEHPVGCELRLHAPRHRGQLAGRGVLVRARSVASASASRPSDRSARARTRSTSGRRDVSRTPAQAIEQPQRPLGFSLAQGQLGGWPGGR